MWVAPIHHDVSKCIVSSLISVNELLNRCRYPDAWGMRNVHKNVYENVHKNAQSQCRIQRWMQSNDSHNWCTPTRNTVAFKVIKIWINANKKFSVSDIDVELFAVSWHCQWITWWRRSCVSAYKSIEMPFPYCPAHVIHSHYRLHHQCHQSTA